MISETRTLSTKATYVHRRPRQLEPPLTTAESRYDAPSTADRPGAVRTDDVAGFLAVAVADTHGDDFGP
jgi:hypothetical protein